MVLSCSACTQRSEKGNGISFHRFPSKPELRNKWLVAIQRIGFVPGSNSKVCSKHFKKEDFIVRFGYKSLVETAIPTMGDLTRNRGKRVIKRPLPSVPLDFVDANSLICVTGGVLNTRVNSIEVMRQPSTSLPVQYMAATSLTAAKSEVFDPDTEPVEVIRQSSSSLPIQFIDVDNLCEQNVINAEPNSVEVTSQSSTGLALSNATEDLLGCDGQKEVLNNTNRNLIIVIEQSSSSSTGCNVGSYVNPALFNNKTAPTFEHRKKSRSHLVYFGDFKEADLKSPTKVRRMWEIAKITIANQKKTIKYLHTVNYRLRKKMELMKEKNRQLKNDATCKVKC